MVGKFAVSSNCGFGDSLLNKIFLTFRAVCLGSGSTGVAVERMFVLMVL